ncbi:MAG: hypothetical protein HY690_14360 [Chloroflexi bacterium]|nr:hypothetical protein [Chloroflexota bacterium]
MLGNLAPSVLHPDHDPAVLAFIKCHVTSLPKWHVLRSLCSQPGRWLDATSLSRQSGHAGGGIAQALAELAREGVLEQACGPYGEPLYRLDAEDPTTTVVCRLAAAISQSHELRQILVANLQQQAVA